MYEVGKYKDCRENPFACLPDYSFKQVLPNLLLLLMLVKILMVTMVTQGIKLIFTQLDQTYDSLH